MRAIMQSFFLDKPLNPEVSHIASILCKNVTIKRKKNKKDYARRGGCDPGRDYVPMFVRFQNSYSPPQ